MSKKCWRVCVTMFLLLVAPHATAQILLDVNRLRPVGDPSGVLASEGAEIPGVLEWQWSFAFQEAVVPFVFTHFDGAREALVEHRLGTEIWGSVGFLDYDLGGSRLRMGVSGNLLVTLLQDGSLAPLAPFGQSPTLAAFALGDFPLRLRLGLHNEVLDMTLEGEVSLPSGNAKALNGDGVLGGGGGIAISGDVGPFRGLVRSGFRSRPEIDLRFLRSASEWWTQAGASYRLEGRGVIPKEIGVEADFAAWSLATFSEPPTTALEWRAGARWCVFGLLVTGAIGTGASKGYGTPAVRVLTSVGYASNACGASPSSAQTPVPETEVAPPPSDEARPAVVIEREPPPAPVVVVEPPRAEKVVSPPVVPTLEQLFKLTDSDDDGVLDSDDDCPDKEGPADNHGCPKEPVASPDPPPSENPLDLPVESPEP